MTVNDKLKDILIRLLTERIEKQTKSIADEMATVCPDMVTPGYDSRLEKIATVLVQKAEEGDIKSIDKIREIVGDVDWLPDVVL